MALYEVIEGKSIHVAWTNSDLTEGRGHSIALAVCESRWTALRLGKGKSTQGSDCHVTEEIAIRVRYGMNTHWMIPGKIVAPSKEDKALDEKSEAEQKIKDEKEIVIKRAKELGLSDDDIQTLRK